MLYLVCWGPAVTWPGAEEAVVAQVWTIVINLPGALWVRISHEWCGPLGTDTPSSPMLKAQIGSKAGFHRQHNLRGRNLKASSLSGGFWNNTSKQQIGKYLHFFWNVKISLISESFLGQKNPLSTILLKYMISAWTSVCIYTQCSRCQQFKWQNVHLYMLHIQILTLFILILLTLSHQLKSAVSNNFDLNSERLLF